MQSSYKVNIRRVKVFVTSNSVVYIVCILLYTTTLTEKTNPIFIFSEVDSVTLSLSLWFWLWFWFYPRLIARWKYIQKHIVPCLCIFILFSRRYSLRSSLFTLHFTVSRPFPVCVLCSLYTVHSTTWNMLRMLRTWSASEHAGCRIHGKEMEEGHHLNIAWIVCTVRLGKVGWLARIMLSSYPVHSVFTLYNDVPIVVLNIVVFD